MIRGMSGVMSAFILVGAAASISLAEDGTNQLAKNSAEALSQEALDECHIGRSAKDRHVRLAHFKRGRVLAEQAVKLDDQVADGHFAIFCNHGEQLRLDGEILTSVFELKTVMDALDQTLALDPNHIDALSAKGTFLVRLPWVLGGDPSKGERMLRRVIKEAPDAVNARLVLARSCESRGEHEEAVRLAEEALEYAIKNQRDDLIPEAMATLADLQMQSS